jgi:hypothetical protein
MCSDESSNQEESHNHILSIALQEDRKLEELPIAIIKSTPIQPIIKKASGSSSRDKNRDLAGSIVLNKTPSRKGSGVSNGGGGRIKRGDENVVDKFLQDMTSSRDKLAARAARERAVKFAKAQEGQATSSNLLKDFEVLRFILLLVHYSLMYFV